MTSISLVPTPAPSIRANSLFVDTSGWVGLVGRDERLHREVEYHYRRSIRERRGIVTTSYIVTEIVALLTNRPIVPRTRMIEFVESLYASSQVIIIFVDQDINTESWSLLKARPDKDWSLVDASSFVIMQRYGMIDALTTDDHFRQAGFIRLPEI